VADWTALFSTQRAGASRLRRLCLWSRHPSQAMAAKARAELRNRNDRLVDKIAGAEEALEPHQFPPSELLRGLCAASVRGYAAGDVGQFVEREVVLARVRRCDKWPYIKSRSCSRSRTSAYSRDYSASRLAEPPEGRTRRHTKMFPRVGWPPQD
jgi:hypothetical protein